ncbi:serine hydrolase [Actinospica sp.]|jgi:beta-lactamase class A|uniref:serine hydrolase n=1 Tax=Actinospica sp. TaxID=1872142 RepID=UPI002C2C19E5|nr:serine hydrolase [Actinospica sp.]HWG25007.1 serine hydrolase [Actinospica sp.]
MIEDDVEALFTASGYRGMLSVAEIDGPGRVGVRAAEQAYAASTFKIAVGLELLCQAAAGELDPAETVRLSPDERTPGGQGLCLFAHTAEVSLRDLAVLMLTISDNTATDAVIRRVGPERIAARMAALGLAHTDFTCTIREHFDAIGRGLGFADLAEHGRALAEAAPARAAEMRRAFYASFAQPDTVPYTTAQDMARLVRLIWRDEAGPAAACADLRAMMGSQWLTRKIATGFDADVSIAAKSGTVATKAGTGPGAISNDVGAVMYPDGQRYAVAVFTQELDPDADPDSASRVIGAAAQMAVEYLRRAATGVRADERHEP